MPSWFFKMELAPSYGKRYMYAHDTLLWRDSLSTVNVSTLFCRILLLTLCLTGFLPLPLPALLRKQLFHNWFSCNYIKKRSSSSSNPKSAATSFNKVLSFFANAHTLILHSPQNPLLPPYQSSTHPSAIASHEKHPRKSN